ncbi:FecR domain-containing protein [Calycomorphotria hydatis]|uniref:FecR protein n=1 Tax=Calycomorphotria hydatis TaxID=2528027 RepID=A0A517TB76_9PLAN|nr:FecR domain-containing protein [Calycomorphotria hydatis]QDT65615.1 FecR protein [Calycomorphotria hydatis]
MKDQAIQSEIEGLADDVCRGLMSPEKSERLSALLAADFSNCHIYLNYMEIHGALGVYGEQATSDQLYDQVFIDRKKLRRRQALISSVSVTLAMMLMVGVGALFWVIKPPVVATVTGCSTNAEWTGYETIPLGRLLRRGDAINLRSGLLTLENSLGVVVDIKAPCELTLSDLNGLQLSDGSIRAIVGEEGQGFFVNTSTCEVVDYGTEFLVTHSSENGTEVSVNRGKVEAFLLDSIGARLQTISLTPGQSARVGAGEIIDLADFGGLSQWFQSTKGGIRRVDGYSRLLDTRVNNLAQGEKTTTDHVLVLPENQGVTLENDITIRTRTGQLQLNAGDRLSSYLVHYDPGSYNTKPPKGSVTFHQPVTALVSDTDALNQLDAIVANRDTIFNNQLDRGLERDSGEDIARVEKDGKTVFFHFDTDPGATFEEFRILIVE